MRYPDVGGPNHAATVWAAADTDEEVADLALHIGPMPSETRAAFCARLTHRLAAEAPEHQDALFVFSTEHAHCVS